MLLSRKYRDRAVGLVGAFAFLITGVFASGAVDLAPAKGASSAAASNAAAPMHATEASLDRSKTKKAADCQSALECRSEFFC